MKGTAEGAPLQERFTTAYEYSDCWVEDSRLVVLNARDAQARGASILTRTKVLSAEREDGVWRISKTGYTRVLNQILDRREMPYKTQAPQWAVDAEASASERG